MIESWEQWKPNYKAINKGYGKRKGMVMFPTSHDITTETLEYCIIVLRKLLSPGNRVLIVSKPDPYCIKLLTLKLEEYKNQILFRFTITSMDNKQLEKWEPNAPSLKDRLFALKYVFQKGFETSVNIGPFLDKNPYNLICLVSPYITETIWIEPLNYFKTDFNSWSNIQKVVNNIKKLPIKIKEKIRIKDSIINQYKRHGMEVTLFD